MASHLDARPSRLAGLCARPRRRGSRDLRCRRRSAARTAGAGRRPRLRPEREDLRSEHVDERDQGDRRRDRRRSRSRTSSGRSATRCSSCPARYGTAADPAQLPGRLLHRGRRASAASPSDVAVNGTIDVYNQCFGPDDCTALVNFWRSLSNLTINVAGQGRLPVRRVLGDVAGRADAARARQRLHDAHGLLHGPVLRERRLHRRLAVLRQHRRQRLAAAVPGPEQQPRRLDERRLEPGLRRRPGRAARSRSRTRRTRRSTTNPASREKPFLYVDANEHFNVFVPDAQLQLVGHDVGQRPDARPLDPDRELLHRQARRTASSRSTTRSSHGKNLIFTPGVYDVDKTIKVKRADTIVLGLGMATLDGAERRRPDDGRRRAGRRDLRADLRRGPGELAGAARGRQPARRPAGARHNGSSDPSDPSALHDVFFRIGGPHVGKATVSLEVDRDNVILDDIWAWRADHGNGVGWTSNTADTGVVVNGDNVVATGLFVEHYQKYNVFWAGENGKTIMFQNEMPYDPPNQAAWQHDGVARLGRLQGRRLGQDPRGLGPRQLLLLQRRSDDPREPRLRGAGDAGREAARHPHPLDHEPRHDRPRRERRRARRRRRTRPRSTSSRSRSVVRP